MTERALQVKAIVGPGRSGTTWAGTLVDSCPDVIYRFEPFHRLAEVVPEIGEWFRKLKQQEVRDADIPRIYELLRPAEPLTNKEPYFCDKSYKLNTAGRRQLWPIARTVRPARSLYRSLYSPQPGPPLVFKEVTFIKPLRNLLEFTTIPVVYLVRHPAATVLSIVKGPQGGSMIGRSTRIEQLLHEHSPALADEFRDIVVGNDPVSRTALLWRCEVDACIELSRRSATALIMTYEQLAGDTIENAKSMFAHLDIPFGSPTVRFIESLRRIGSAAQSRPKRTGWGRSYFSVLRNPADEKDSWKRRIAPEDRSKIERIVRDSPAFRHCAGLGAWD